MSRDSHKDYYNRDLRDRRDPRDMRHRVRDERDYRNYDRHRKRTPTREDGRRSRSPKKDLLDDNIMREIAKLPEPSELWAPHNSGAPPPPGTGFAEPLPSYTQNYQPTYSGLYDDFAPMPGPPQPPEWSQMHLPPPSLPTPPAPAPAPPTLAQAPPPPVIEPRAPSFEDQVKKEAAIESEMRHQKLALSKQREDYMKKAGILKKELDTLKDQRNELRGDPKRSPSPDTKRFLKENTKLQLEIQNKLKTITNVVDMLNGIIGENAQELKIESDDDSLDKPSKRRSRSPTSNKFNYVYYDPEMHWCRVCNEFPPTAKDYLNHLHSPQHHKMAAAHMEAPWHSLPPQNEGFPSYPSAPTKRTPIRGLQFFVPSTAWYCKLCDQFIGDLHCASAHLKSISHSKNYHNFVEQNPHWETDWMSDRQKAVEKTRNKPKAEERLPPQPPPPVAMPQHPPQYASHTITFHKDGSYTKRKDSPPSMPVEEEKKKKDKKKRSKKRKKSSSSSSDSDSSSSATEADRKKKKKKSTKEEEDDGRLLNEWMSSLHSGRLSSSERRLMESLKQRMKQEEGRQGSRNTPDTHSRNREREAERRLLEDRSRNEEPRGKEETRRNADRRRDETRDTQRRDREPENSKPKKMPFIGKMPVYKSLSKARAEEQKKDDTKKQEDDQKDKKRREEIDAEIQKKVAEFKEKIAKAQEEREKLSAEPIMVPMPPPGVAIPQRAASILGPPPVNLSQPPPPATMPNLPKDFQEALDIIFPSKHKAEMQDDMFPSIPGLGGFPFNPFQGMNIMPPPMPQMPPQMPPPMPQMPPQMPQMGFGMNQPMFPRFDNMPQNNKNSNNNRQQNSNRQQRNQNKNNQQAKNYKQFINSGGKMNGEKKAKEDQAKREEAAKNSVAAKKKIEELDDLAMLGIDASDVGSGL